RGSMLSDRSSLYIRSVPMLPGPTIAAVAFFVTLISLAGALDATTGEAPLGRCRQSLRIGRVGCGRSRSVGTTVSDAETRRARTAVAASSSPGRGTGQKV